MPFPLTNVPAILQRAFDTILMTFKGKICLVYLEDMIIFAKTIDDRILNDAKISTTLTEANMTGKISRCHFFSATVEYLGHLINPGKLDVDNANTNSL